MHDSAYHNSRTLVVRMHWPHLAMLCSRAQFKKSLFAINQYSLPAHKVMGLTAYGGEIRDTIIKLIPFKSSRSLTGTELFQLAFISLFIGGGTEEPVGWVCLQVCKCWHLQCVCYTFLWEYICTFTVTIFTYAVQDTNLCSIFLNFVIMDNFLSIWFQ
jgi:hypothetical protein